MLVDGQTHSHGKPGKLMGCRNTGRTVRFSWREKGADWTGSRPVVSLNWNVREAEYEWWVIPAGGNCRSTTPATGPPWALTLLPALQFRSVTLKLCQHCHVAHTHTHTHYSQQRESMIVPCLCRFLNSMKHQPNSDSVCNSACREPFHCWGEVSTKL